MNVKHQRHHQIINLKWLMLKIILSNLLRTMKNLPIKYEDAYTKLKIELHLKVRNFFSVWVFFHEQSQFIGQQGTGEGIYSTPFYHVHLLHRHLDISQVIAAESSPLHIASSRI